MSRFNFRLTTVASLIQIWKAQEKNFFSDTSTRLTLNIHNLNRRYIVRGANYLDTLNTLHYSIHFTTHNSP